MVRVRLCVGGCECVCEWVTLAQYIFGIISLWLLSVDDGDDETWLSFFLYSSHGRIGQWRFRMKRRRFVFCFVFCASKLNRSATRISNFEFRGNSECENCASGLKWWFSEMKNSRASVRFSNRKRKSFRMRIVIFEFFFVFAVSLR